MDEVSRQLRPAGQSTSNSVTPELYEPLEGSLRKFIPAAWPVLYPEADFIPGRHIDAIADHLEAGLRFEFDILVINVPPGFMKSTIGCVMFPAWAWANDPTLGFMYVSYHEKLSTRDSVRTRDLISSAWYQGGWRHRVRLKADQNEKKRFETDKGGVRQSSTVGGFGTGEHVDVLFVDDPHNAIDVRSPAAMLETHFWWDTSTAGRFKNPSRFLRVISAQRLSSLDLCAHVLDTGGKVCHLKIPMKYKPSDSYVTSIGWRDWRSAEDELAWPEFMSAEAVRSAEATLGPAGVAAQHQQAPIAEGGSFFRSEFFRYFAWETETPAAAETDVESRSRVRLKTPEPADAPGVFVLRQPDGATKRFYAAECVATQYFDTAMKTGQDNDYTVCLTGFRTPEGDLLVFDVVRARIPIPRQFPWIVSQRSRFPWLSGQCVESKASGEGLLQQGDASGYPLRELKAVADKQTRAQPVATAMERGKVYFLAGAPWLVDFEAELLSFPGEHDDQVDALAYFGLDSLAAAARPFRVRQLSGD